VGEDTHPKLAYARKVLAVFHVAEAWGHASCTVDGKMIDYPVGERAKRVLAAAEGLSKSVR